MWTNEYPSSASDGEAPATQDEVYVRYWISGHASTEIAEFPYAVGFSRYNNRHRPNVSELIQRKVIILAYRNHTMVRHFRFHTISYGEFQLPRAYLCEITPDHPSRSLHQAASGVSAPLMTLDAHLRNILSLQCG